MDAQQAVSMPHFVNRSGSFELEQGTYAETFADELKAIGFKVKVRSLNSSLHAIVVEDSGLAGGADPRREGAVIGN